MGAGRVGRGFDAYHSLDGSRPIPSRLGASALVMLCLGLTGCPGPDEPLPEPGHIEIVAPEVFVQADEVEVRAMTTSEVDTLRYAITLSTVDGEAGNVATGKLTPDGEHTFSGLIPLDTEGRYHLRVTGHLDGRTIAEDSRDFRYAFVPAPVPILPELDEATPTVKVSALPARYPLIVQTRPGIRVEAARGDELLDRATAATDRVELDIELIEGRNDLVVRTWRRQSSAEVAVTLTAEFDITAPPPPPPPSVEQDCRRGRVQKAWKARGRLEDEAAAHGALAVCLIRGAARARDWHNAADFVEGLGRAAAELPSPALALAAEIFGEAGRGDGRDRLWSRLVDRIAAASDDAITTARAHELGERIRASGAPDAVLLGCIDHDTAGHPCQALLRGAGAPPPPPDDNKEIEPPRDPPVEPAGPLPADQIATACDAHRYDAAAIAYRSADTKPTLDPAQRLCVTLGLRLTGRCRDVIEVAEPLRRRTVNETVPAARLTAECHATLGRKDEAAEHWRRAIELALQGDSAFLMGPDRVREALDESDLNPTQRATATAPCAQRPEHGLCAAIVDTPPRPKTSLADLCRAGDHADATQHPDAQDSPSEHVLCLARGWIERGQPTPARKVLRSAIEALEPGARLGEVSRLLSTISTGKEAIGAMQRAVEMLAQSLYRVPDEATFYADIRAVRGDGAIEEIISPCREASRRDACKRLLAHFDQTARRPPVEGSHQDGSDAHRSETRNPATAGTQAPETPPPSDQPGKKTPKPPPPESGTDVVGRPVGARLVLRVDSGPIERATPSGEFVFDESELPPGTLRFTLTAPGHQTRRGTINLGARDPSHGPIKLYAPKSSAHLDYSAGEQALGKGDIAAAITAFERATRADSDHCMAYAYLGYVQGLAGKLKQAQGSFARCSSSLTNDIEAVATAKLLQRVIEMRTRIDDASADQIASLIRGLRGSHGTLRYAHKVLPSSKRATVDLSKIYKYWNATAHTARWRALSEGGAPAEDACREALRAWRRIPASQVSFVGGRRTDTQSDFADERARSLQALGAACP